MRFDQRDTIALLAVPLIVAAFKAENSVFAALCLCLAGAMVVFAIARHDELLWKQRFGLGAFVLLADLAALFYLYRVNGARELTEQTAPIIAAALPQPVSSNCPIPKNAVGLYLGNRVSVITEFPHVVFRTYGNDVLRIDRPSSDLLITFRVFNDRGALVARLNRNTFSTKNSASHVERPDVSHLNVFADRGTEVLDVQFLNPQAIKLTGILRYPGVDPIVISEKYAGRGGSIMPQSCSTGTEPDFEGN
jgi:hypothetical protein